MDNFSDMIILRGDINTSCLSATWQFNIYYTFDMETAEWVRASTERKVENYSLNIAGVYEGEQKVKTGEKPIAFTIGEPSKTTEMSSDMAEFFERCGVSEYPVFPVTNCTLIRDNYEWDWYEGEVGEDTITDLNGYGAIYLSGDNRIDICVENGENRFVLQFSISKDNQIIKGLAKDEYGEEWSAIIKEGYHYDEINLTKVQ